MSGGGSLSFFLFFSLIPFALGLTSEALFPPASQLGIRDWFKSEIRPSTRVAFATIPMSQETVARKKRKG